MAHKYNLYMQLYVSTSEAQKHTDQLQEARMTLSDIYETKNDFFSEDCTK